MSVTSIVLDVGLVTLGVIGLWLGATQFVRGASRLARRLGVSGLVIGLTIVAFGTSAPEFAVTLDAALAGKSDISIANVLGSNLFNLGFILGGAALVAVLPTSKLLVRRDSAALVGATLLVLGLVSDRFVSRLDGIVLVVLLVAYLAVLVRTDAGAVSAQTASNSSFSPSDIARLGGGLAIVVLGAHGLVFGASDLARVAGVSEWLIGVTIVAAGTSTPEFVTSIAAARQGRAGISAGNIVGSCLFNFLGVLGVAGVVQPLPVSGDAVWSLWWLLGVVLLVTVFLWSKQVLSRLEGAVLVLLNAANWAIGLLS